MCCFQFRLTCKGLEEPSSRSHVWGFPVEPRPGRIVQPIPVRKRPVTSPVTRPVRGNHPHLGNKRLKDPIHYPSLSYRYPSRVLVQVTGYLWVV